MEINWVEWLGYSASLVVLVSLTMSSILKLRWINLVGSMMFATYGFRIGSIPTGFMNAGIVCINLYYLYKIYTTKENIKLVKADKDSDYLKYLFDINKEDIKAFISDNEFNKSTEIFYMLRNNNTAGILAGRKEDKGKTFFIDLDYVTPRYRDFKLGNHFFNKNTKVLKELGYSKLKTISVNNIHNSYLIKMGFVKNNSGVYEKYI